MRCIRCKRPLKHASESGMGWKCERKAKPTAIPDAGRDLFGFDVPAAAKAAVERLRVHIEVLSVDAVMAIRSDFVAARRRLGVWA